MTLRGLTLEDRLLTGIEDTPSGCWEWQRTRNAKGYGHISQTVDGKFKQLYAHRVAWELEHGPVPDGMCVLHHCDNPPCCNPSHLFLGTRSDNHADMMAKGRQPLGERNGRFRFSNEQVARIHHLRSVGWGQQQIADEIGCARSYVSRVLAGRLRGTSPAA